MKLVKGYALIKQTELDDALKNAEVEGAKKGEKSSKARIVELEKGLEKKTRELEKANDKHELELEKINDNHNATTSKLNRKIEIAETKVDILEKERDEVRDVVKQQLDNDDKEMVLDARKDSLDSKEAALKDRENKLESKEEGRYKTGYADGVADGVRKISEITQKDRDNAMKIAMVSAASHTPLQNIKEINSEYRLTAGTEDSED